MSDPTPTPTPPGPIVIQIKLPRLSFPSRETLLKLFLAAAIFISGYTLGGGRLHWPHPSPPSPTAPFASDGLRVLIVYESADLAKYPRTQAVALYDQSLRDYLTTAAKGWRLLDKDSDVSAESKEFQAAMARPHPVLPWIEISNGKTGFEGPLPVDAASIKALVQKYEVKP